MLFAVGAVHMGCQFSLVLQGNKNNNEAVQGKQSQGSASQRWVVKEGIPLLVLRLENR